MKTKAKKVTYPGNTKSYHGKTVTRLQYLDVELDQSVNILNSFPKLFDHIKNNKQVLSRILEIGSSRGGLTFTISELYGEPIDTVSYDINHSRVVMKNKYPELCKTNKIDFRGGNCFDPIVTDVIKKFIQQPGLSLVLCDGGDKHKEFNTFAPIIKDSDIIMLHDYADTREDFKLLDAENVWFWHEASYAGISKTVEEYNLTRILRDDFITSVWGVFQK